MATAQELQTLVVRLLGDDTGYEQMLNHAEAVTTKTTRAVTASFAQMSTSIKASLQANANSMAMLGTKMAVGITLPVAGMVMAYSDFDGAMTKSTAIMGNMSAEVRKEMEMTARVIGTSSVTSSTKAAEAYYFLASAGMDAKQSIAALPVVEKFAVAGAFDMATATDLLTDAQSALGLSSKDAAINMKNMGNMSDILVRAATLANASVRQFSESLTNEAGPAMNNLNMDTEEGVAILAAYADQGIKGNVAGSNLSRMLRLITATINENAGAYNKLGIDVSEFATTGKNFTSILEGVTRATEGMGPALKAATLDALGFKARIQGAVLPLLGVTEKIRGYERELRKAGGTTKDVADKQMASFGSQMTMVWNRLKDVSTALGEKLAPAIGMVASALGDLVLVFNSMPSALQSIIAGVVGLAGAAGPLLIAVSFATKLFDKLKVGAVMLVELLPGLATGMGGLGLKVAGVLALVAAVWELSFAAGRVYRELITGENELEAVEARRRAAMDKENKKAERKLQRMAAQRKFYDTIIAKADALNFVQAQTPAIVGEIAETEKALSMARQHGLLQDLPKLNDLLEEQQGILRKANADAYLAGTDLGLASIEELDQAIKDMQDEQLSAEEKITKEIENRWRLIGTIQASAGAGADPTRTIERVAAVEQIILNLEKEKGELASARLAEETRHLDELRAMVNGVSDPYASERAQLAADMERLKEATTLKIIDAKSFTMFAAQLKKGLEDTIKKPFSDFVEGLRTRFKTPVEKLQEELRMLQSSFEAGVLGKEEMDRLSGLLKKDAEPAVSDSGVGRAEAQQATILSSNMSLASMLRTRQDEGGPKEQIKVAREGVEEQKKTNKRLEDVNKTIEESLYAGARAG